MKLRQPDGSRQPVKVPKEERKGRASTILGSLLIFSHGGVPHFFSECCQLHLSPSCLLAGDYFRKTDLIPLFLSCCLAFGNSLSPSVNAWCSVMREVAFLLWLHNQNKTSSPRLQVRKISDRHRKVWCFRLCSGSRSNKVGSAGKSPSSSHQGLRKTSLCQGIISQQPMVKTNLQVPNPLPALSCSDETTARGRFYLQYVCEGTGTH